MKYTLTITGFQSDAAKAMAARIIASSEGFFCDEEEALTLLGTVPVTISFEAERIAGQQTLEGLRKAGCEMSSSQQESEVLRAGASQMGFTKGRLARDFSDEQLEILERRVNRMPTLFVLSCVLSFLSGWMGVQCEAYLVVLGSMLLVVFTLAGAYASRSQEAWGLTVSVTLSGLGAILAGVLALSGLGDVYTGAMFRRIATVGPFVILPLAMPVALGVVCAFCMHIFFTLLKKPVREWFSSF